MLGLALCLSPAAAVPAVGQEATEPVTVQMDGPFVALDDFPRFVTGLRELGLSEIAIKRIVWSEVTGLYERRQAETKRQQLLDAGAEYWQTELERASESDENAGSDDYSFDRTPDPLEVEKAQTIESLLGEPIDVINGRVHNSVYGYGGPRVDYLPSDEKQALRSIWNEAELQRIALQAQSEAVDWQDLDQITTDAYAAMEAELSGEQLFLFRVHNSEQAQELRNQLGTLDPDQPTFDTLLRNWFDKGWNPLDDEGDHAEEMNRELQALLGDEGYAELVKIRQPKYSVVADLLANEGFGLDHLDALYPIGRKARAEVGEAKKNTPTTDLESAEAAARTRRDPEPNRRDHAGPDRAGGRHRGATARLLRCATHHFFDHPLT